jgi:predicted Zn-dependent protease
LLDSILEPVAAIEATGAEFVGLHSQGPQCRGSANSRGARHFFASETFSTSWSACLPNGKAVKSTYAGRAWKRDEWESRLRQVSESLEALGRHEKILAPGAYRCFLAPDAVDAFLPFFSWDGLSERAFREGSSAWTALRDGREVLSPKFGLTQDFGLGVEPRFNSLGEVAPEKLRLIEAGKLAASLVSSRSARQYGATSNAAPEWEGLRSASLDAGDLEESEILEALGTGLYISNLHYLNWSDNATARVTGMTRHACLWVEKSRIVAPIRDMRFDESLFRLWGTKLEALTKMRSVLIEDGSYDHRDLGGALLPGMLIDGFTFTL